MDKKEFLNRLKEDLSSLSDDERQNALKYYEEYFAEAEAEEEKGKVAAEFVSPEDFAHKIELELAQLTEEKQQPEQPEQHQQQQLQWSPPPPNRPKNSSAKLILLLCTFPLWLPLLIALASTAFGLCISLIAIALAGFAMVGVGLVAVGYGAFHIFTNVSSAFYPLGIGFVTAGIGVIMAYGFTKLSMVMFKLPFGIIRGALKKGEAR